MGEVNRERAEPSEPKLIPLCRMARRPHAIRAHIVKNRYLMILKNDRPGAFLRDLPFILSWELVQWGWLLLASPGTLPYLWRSRGLFARVLRRRRRMAAAGA